MRRLIRTLRTRCAPLRTEMPSAQVVRIHEMMAFLREEYPDGWEHGRVSYASRFTAVR